MSATLGTPPSTIENPSMEKVNDKQLLGPSEEFKPGWRFYLAFLSLTITVLMVAVDATSLPVALPLMSKDLNGSALEAFWSGTAFLLASTAFQIVLGSLSRIFGRKPILFLSLLLFGAGAITAAIAKGFSTILIGRSFQGIGGGGIITVTDILITDMIPLRFRGQWSAFINSAWAIGTVTGPLLGGGFAQSLSWRWIFWINLPFVVVGSCLITIFLHLDHNPSTLKDKLCQIDYLGALLLVMSLAGFLIPLTWAGVQYPWSHWKTIFPLTLGALGLMLFVAWEESLIRRGVEPLIRLDGLKSRTGGVTFVGVFIHSLVLWLLLYFQPFYFEAIKGQSLILAGVSLFPQTFTVAPAAIVTGIIITRTGRYRWATWSGWVLTVLGIGLLMCLKEDTSTTAWVCLSLIGGVGTGLLFSPMMVAVQALSMDKTVIVHTVTLFAAFRAFGQAVGVAVGGVVFQNVIKRELRVYPLLAPYADKYSRDASSLVEIIKAMPSGVAKTQLLHSYMRTLRVIYVVCTALAGVGLLSSLWTERLQLNQALETEQGFRHRDKKSDEETSNEGS